MIKKSLIGEETLPFNQSRIIEQDRTSLHILLSVKHLKNK